jgi:hypothetical protein
MVSGLRGHRSEDGGRALRVWMGASTGGTASKRAELSTGVADDSGSRPKSSRTQDDVNPHSRRGHPSFESSLPPPPPRARTSLS